MLFGIYFFLSSSRRHTRCALVSGVQSVLFRSNYEILDWLKRERGEERATWMNGRIRNLELFPNVFLMDQTSTQIRIIRPISVDETEVTTYCIAPVGESDDARALRIRQYEDFRSEEHTSELQSLMRISYAV